MDSNQINGIQKENTAPSEGFSYVYSASEQNEAKRIRDKYLSNESDKMAKLRALDAGVTRRGTVLSLVLGIISALVLGVGMCCSMVWGGNWFIPGIFIGILGIVGVSLTYPLYTYVVSRDKARIAPEILRLTDELLNK